MSFLPLVPGIQAGGISNMTKLSGSLALAGVILLTLSRGAVPVSAQTGRNGQLHATKDCSEATGLPGGHCTIESSDLSEIVPGSRVYYDQAGGIPAGLLDSNVVLDAGNGNRAVGRCTLDLT